VKEQLQKFWEDGTIPQTANFYAVTKNNMKYGGFTFEEFMGLSVDDLELLGKFGNRVKSLYAAGEYDEKVAALKKLLREELKNPAPTTK
jgi:hypothetical protein